MAVVNELITKFTYQGTIDPVNAYTKGLSGAFNMLGAFAGLQGLFAGGIAAMTMQVVDQADALGDLSQRTGVAAEAIQKLGYAAMMNGSSTAAMESSLESLNRQIGLAAQGEKMQADTFKELGISVKDAEGNIKSADAVFAEMQNTLSGKSPQEIAAVLRKLRLDPTLAQTLGLSAEEMAKLNAEAEDFGIMTTEQIEQAQAFNDSLDKLKRGLGGFTNQMMLSVAPAIMDGIEGFKEFLSANKELISGGLKLVIDFIAGGFHVMQSMWTVVNGLVNAFGGWTTVLWGAGIAMAALNFKMLLNPAVWVAAGIMALLLIVDDLVTAFNGGESVIGSFFAAMNVDIVQLLKNSLAAMLIPIDAVLLAFYTLTAAAADFFNLMGAGIDTRGFENDIRRVEKMANEHMAMIAAGYDVKVSAPKPAMSGSTASTTQNNSVVVNVQGASDPQKTADLTSKAVQKEVQAAKINNTRGGR